MARQDDHVRHTIRIPRDIYERICALPGEGSINAKIINTLDANSGQTLRDQFALAALTGIISNSSAVFVGASFTPWARHAEEAYKVADAMMSARRKGDA